MDNNLGMILTCDNLIKIGYTLVWWYRTCQCSGETLDHLLLYCMATFDLWLLCFAIFWDLVGDAETIMDILCWLVELVGLTFFICLETSSFMSVVDGVARSHSLYI